MVDWGASTLGWLELLRLLIRQLGIIGLGAVSLILRSCSNGVIDVSSRGVLVSWVLVHELLLLLLNSLRHLGIEILSRWLVVDHLVGLLVLW